MNNLNCSSVKTFIGSKDFNESRDFYISLGWKLNFDRGDIAELELEGSSFYLQKYYQKDWCENTMLYIAVEDAEAWYKYVTTVLENNSFGDARVQAPIKQDYGALVTFVHDPSGVLLHFAQMLETK